MILASLNESGIIKISEIAESLNTTEMTIRRDLKQLEEDGLLVRIHGGAKIKDTKKFEELSPNEKRNKNKDKKQQVAKIAASLIKENEAIYIGPGTTNEYIYDYINVSYAKIITNCLLIFDKFKDDDRFETILIGGKLRKKTSTFVGSLTNESLQKLKVKTAFIGANGVHNNEIMTSNEEEGSSQRIILNNAERRYLLCDSTKIEKEDFYTLYNLEDMTGLITDNELEKDLRKKYLKYCDVIDKVFEEER